MKTQVQLEELKDAHGTPINIGDIVVAARAHRFGDTTFSYLLITGRTKGMVRARKVDSMYNGGLTKANALAALRSTYGSTRKRGAVLGSWNLLNTGTQLLTETELDDFFNTQDTILDAEEAAGFSTPSYGTPFSLSLP